MNDNKTKKQKKKTKKNRQPESFYFSFVAREGNSLRRLLNKIKKSYNCII